MRKESHARAPLLMRTLVSVQIECISPKLSSRYRHLTVVTLSACLKERQIVFCFSQPGRGLFISIVNYAPPSQPRWLSCRRRRLRYDRAANPLAAHGHRNDVVERVGTAFQEFA